jgi:Immunity protein 35
MIDQRTAASIARRHLEREFPAGDVVLDEAATIQADWCWVFCFNTRAFLATGDPRDSLAGNGPLLVDKRSGTLRQAGTAHPVEHYLAAWRDGAG